MGFAFTVVALSTEAMKNVLGQGTHIMSLAGSLLDLYYTHRFSDWVRKSKEKHYQVSCLPFAV